MITLFASIAGFLTSIFPEILKFSRDKQDKLHELAILDRQIEMAKNQTIDKIDELIMHNSVLEQSSLYSTYKSGINWVDALNASVRPVLAYSFFGIYSLIKYTQYKALNSLIDMPISVYTEIIWSVDDQAIFAGIISFYFGQRTFSRLSGKR